MISFKQLRYLDLLAATGHFGKAADRAGVTQPALSMQIRALEKELGGALIERRSGGARLTELGRGRRRARRRRSLPASATSRNWRWRGANC